MRETPCCLLLAFLTFQCLAGCDDDRYARSDVAGDNDVGHSDEVGQEAPDTHEDARADVGVPDVEPDANHVEVGVDAPPDVHIDTGNVVCDQLGETACIETHDCVLELGPNDSYQCRPTRNHCERMVDPESCIEDDSCAWDPGFCYCPPEVLCGCGGGPPPVCRLLGDPILCRGAQPSCGYGESCCEIDENLGICSPPGLCGGGPCSVLVRLEEHGGLCEHGPCFTNIQVQGDGVILVDNEQPDTPIDDELGDNVLAGILSLLDRIEPAELQDGYGACCNAICPIASCGSDTYITFYDTGRPVRRVRISAPNLAPEPLATLRSTLHQEGYGRMNGPGRPAVCPGFAYPPLDPRPQVTCQSALEYWGGSFNWAGS